MTPNSAKALRRLLQISALLTSFSCAKPLPPALPSGPAGEGPLVPVRFTPFDNDSKVTGVSYAREEKVNRWAVFVFDQESEWFAYGSSSDEGIIVNLRAGRTYQCYSLVNYPLSGPGAIDPSSVRSADELTNKLASLSYNRTDNLVMYGSATVSPSAQPQGGEGEVVPETTIIHVKRLVSRLDVTRVAVDFSGKPALAAKTFTLRRIYVTNAYRYARYASDYIYEELSASRSSWYNSGGWHRGETGDPDCDALLGSPALDVRIETGSPYTVTHSFYTFPNPTSKALDNRQMDLWTRRCTRIILECTMDEKTYYYPVDVPAMERNRIYTVSDIVIKGNGSLDEEELDFDPEALEVTFSPSMDWGALYQVNEES